MKGLFLMIVAALLLGSESWPHAAPAAPLAGFSYSPLISESAGRDPAQDLGRLLDATNPDLVRLPVYWQLVEPERDVLDFSSVDQLLDVVGAHNAKSTVQTRVVLTIGARNFLYPELHEPAWAGARQQPDLAEAQTGMAYRAYVDASITRYRDSPLLYSWQVENEPLDLVVNDLTGEDRISESQLAWEISRVHDLDPAHDVVVTTYDAWNVTADMLQVYAAPVLWRLGGPTGHPQEALDAGDALGLDIYIDGPPIQPKFASVGLRGAWKQQGVDFWANRAHRMGKDLWIAEMQAEPWGSETSFPPRDLLESAALYRQEPVDVVLLWGSGTWLNDPAWLYGVAPAVDLMPARLGSAPVW